MHITFTLWFLTDVPTSFHGHQHVFCLQQTKKLGIPLNLSSWLFHSDRWSLLFAHHCLPFHGTQHTACSLMTIHVLVINFPFIVQYNLLKQLISWQPSLFRTFQSMWWGLTAQAPGSFSHANFPRLTNTRGTKKKSKRHLTAFSVSVHAFVLL